MLHHPATCMIAMQLSVVAMPSKAYISCNFFSDFWRLECWLQLNLTGQALPSCGLLVFDDIAQ